LAAIKEREAALNAFVTVAEDAQPAEELDFSNELAGIPIAIKDNIITKDLRTTASSHILDNFIPVYESTVVQKLKDAQMTIIGKTNLDEFAMGGSTETSYFGTSKNPWDLTKIPGG